MSNVLLADYVLDVERLSLDLQGRARALGFGTHDMRTAFFTNASDALTMYAVSLTLIHAAQQFGRGNFNIVVDGEPEQVRDAIVPRVIEALFKQRDEGGRTLWNWYLGKLKSHLFHESWGAFEDSLRRVYAAVVPVAEQNVNAGVDDAADASKRRHIDLPKVWMRLSRMTKANGTTKDQRRRHHQVMEFLGAARNTVHANTFYDGPERSLEVGSKTLRLVPGSPTDFLHIDTILDLVRELAAAFDFICANVKYNAEITSPTSERDPMNDWPALKR